MTPDQPTRLAEWEHERPREFLEHATKATSQYDRQYRSMAAEILALRDLLVAQQAAIEAHEKLQEGFLRRGDEIEILRRERDEAIAAYNRLNAEYDAFLADHGHDGCAVQLMAAERDRDEARDNQRKTYENSVELAKYLKHEIARTEAAEARCTALEATAKAINADLRTWCGNDDPNAIELICGVRSTLDTLLGEPPEVV